MLENDLIENDIESISFNQRKESRMIEKKHEDQRTIESCLQSDGGLRR